MRLINLIGAAAIAVTMPAVALAAVLGTVNITGDREPGAIFTPTGHVHFVGDGFATSAFGIFDPIVTQQESSDSGFVIDPTVFTLTDIEFESPPITIWSGGGFSFTATSFTMFDNDATTDGTLGFTARGTVGRPAGSSLPGLFMFTTQPDMGDMQISFSSTTQAIPLPASVLMLLAALGGLGVLSRRGKSAAA